jgi:hypothetical protein
MAGVAGLEPATPGFGVRWQARTTPNHTSQLFDHNYLKTHSFGDKVSAG